MKILAPGATGALGSQLVPRLVAAGHDVTGMTRRPARRDAVRQLTALSGSVDRRRMGREMRALFCRREI